MESVESDLCMSVVGLGVWRLNEITKRPVIHCVELSHLRFWAFHSTVDKGHWNPCWSHFQEEQSLSVSLRWDEPRGDRTECFLVLTQITK